MADNGLSQLDVQKLLSNPSSEVRAGTAEKIAKQYSPESLSKSEMMLAEEIFRLMVKDAEVRVREALAQNLKENSSIPRDVAVSLARDVDSVALPIIQFSEVFTSEDLIDIVQGKNPEKQKAVASRRVVQSEVADVLVDQAVNNDVVATLVSNEGADITEDSFQKVVDKYGEIEKIQAPLIDRAELPITVAERLVAKVSEELQEKLLAKHNLPADMATDLVLKSREKATLSLSFDATEKDVKQLIEQLRANGRLTTSIIVRAICMGDIKFFEHAMANLAGIPVENARVLIHDSGEFGLEGLFDKTGLSKDVFPAVRAAIDVFHETEFDGEDNDFGRYTRKMIERILTQYELHGVEFENDDLEYLLTKMGDLPPSQAE